MASGQWNRGYIYRILNHLIRKPGKSSKSKNWGCGYTSRNGSNDKAAIFFTKKINLFDRNLVGLKSLLSKSLLLTEKSELVSRPRLQGPKSSQSNSSNRPRMYNHSSRKSIREVSPSNDSSLSKLSFCSSGPSATASFFLQYKSWKSSPLSWSIACHDSRWWLHLSE